MQPRLASNGLFRRALLVLVVVLFVVACGIAIAAAAGWDQDARPALGEAKASAIAPAASVAGRAGPAVGKANAALSGVRSRGRLLGLVAPLTRRAVGAAGSHTAVRRSGGAAAVSRGRRVTMVGRSLRARVMASA